MHIRLLHVFDMINRTKRTSKDHNYFHRADKNSIFSFLCPEVVIPWKHLFRRLLLNKKSVDYFSLKDLINTYINGELHANRFVAIGLQGWPHKTYIDKVDYTPPCFHSGFKTNRGRVFEAIDFLTRTGQTCTDKRQEFLLLSDISWSRKRWTGCDLWTSNWCEWKVNWKCISRCMAIKWFRFLWCAG